MYFCYYPNYAESITRLKETATKFVGTSNVFCLVIITEILHADKKNFLICREIQKGAVEVKYD